MFTGIHLEYIKSSIFFFTSKFVAHYLLKLLPCT